MESGEILPWQFGVLSWFVAIGVTLFSVCLGLVGSYVLPRFELVYASFGAELPSPTALLVRLGNWLWLASVIAFALWGGWRQSRSRNSSVKRVAIGFVVLGIADGLVLVGVIWALYLPIYKLAIAQ